MLNDPKVDIDCEIADCPDCDAPFGVGCDIADGAIDLLWCGSAARDDDDPSHQDRRKSRLSMNDRRFLAGAGVVLLIFS